jgi:hypothetical protein
VAIFLLGEGEDFIMFLLIGQPNETLEKKKNKTKHQNMHPQLIIMDRKNI